VISGCPFSFSRSPPTYFVAVVGTWHTAVEFLRNTLGFGHSERRLWLSILQPTCQDNTTNPHCTRLLLPVAIAALLTAGSAHAEARRSAQSIPAPTRFSPPTPAPLRTGTPGKVSREEPQRGQLAQRGGNDRSGGERNDASNRGRGDHDRYDNRRYDNDRDEYERGKDHEGHHFGHHDRDDSPGC
jgi:hypothetical protein